MAKIFTLIVPMGASGSTEFEYPDSVWRCYECGNTDGFTSRYYDYTGEREVSCNKCGSEHTDWDGESEPICECGYQGWHCPECNKFLCQECWQWFDNDGQIEDEDYFCNDCAGLEPGD